MPTQIYPKRKDLTMGARSYLVGMKHSPKAKQDSVCDSKHRRLESDLKGKRHLIAVRQVSLDGRNDRIFTKGEDSHALRLESELSDLQAVNTNLRCFATRIKLTHHSDKKDLTVGARSCLVGMTGFEPATSCSQSTRATNCATSRKSIKFAIFIPERV